MLKHLTAYSKNPNEPVQGAVIWLHGLGASGHDFEPLVPHLNLDKNIRFIFPHAPVQAVTINMGLPMPSWYDILSMGPRQVNKQQVKQSVGEIILLMEEEVKKGLKWENIVLAGFSQGGAITLDTAVNLPHKLAGIMALSTYLIDFDHLPSFGLSANGKTPILMMHGTRDPVVELSLAKKSSQALQDAGYNLEWKTYVMEHQVCPAQIKAIGSWLNTCFKA